MFAFFEKVCYNDITTREKLEFHLKFSTEQTVYFIYFNF